MLTDGQCTKWHRNIAENFNHPSRVHDRHRQTTARSRSLKSVRYVAWYFQVVRCKPCDRQAYKSHWQDLLLSLGISSWYTGHRRHRCLWA